MLPATRFAPLIFFYCQCITHLKITREDPITNPSSLQLVLFLFLFDFSPSQHRKVQILHLLGYKTLTLSYHCMKGSENSESLDLNFRFVSQEMQYFNFSMFGSTIGCVLRCPKNKLCDKSLQNVLLKRSV